VLDRPRGALAAALLALAACSEAEGPAELVAALAWDHPDERHGGLSGLEVGPDGIDAVAITDRAVLVTARIEREGGVPVGFADVRHHAMTTPEGRALQGYAADSEGLAVAGDEVVVGFEGYHRIWRLALDGGGTGRLPLLDAYEDLPGNAGPEAVAVDGTAVLAVAEHPLGDVFPVLRWEGGAWRVAARLPARGPMKAVGADIGPDGRLYLLERRLTPLGFRSRVRRFAPDGSGEDTLLDTPPGLHGNLEGIAVWRDDTGALRLTMVSDDNFIPGLRGELVEYRLPPETARGLDRGPPGG
jgi:hypothetical protein